MTDAHSAPYEPIESMRSFTLTAGHLERVRTLRWEWRGLPVGAGPECGVEMVDVLQIIFDTGSFAPGVYRLTRAGWRPERDVIFVHCPGCTSAEGYSVSTHPNDNPCPACRGHNRVKRWILEEDVDAGDLRVLDQDSAVIGMEPKFGQTLRWSRLKRMPNGTTVRRTFTAAARASGRGYIAVEIKTVTDEPVILPITIPPE